MITIITPNFNKELFISETINSVFTQTYQDWELIIVDDGSTDNSIEVISSFVKKDSRIKLIQRARLPKGGSTCRNIGLENSKGNYIIFLDSDDLLISTALENRLKEIQSNNSLDFVVSVMGTFYIKIGDSKSNWIPPTNNHLTNFLSHNLPWQTMQPLWKKDFLLNINGFDEEFPRLQDVEMHTRSLMQNNVNFKILQDNEPDCFYRIDESRIVDNYSEFINKWVGGSLLYLEKMYSEIEKINVDVPSRKRALKGTVISMVNHILYNTEINNITQQEGEKFISKILENVAVVKLGSISFLKFYIKLYKFGLYKIKGFNFLSKKIMMMLKLNTSPLQG